MFTAYRTAMVRHNASLWFVSRLGQPGLPWCGGLFGKKNTLVPLQRGKYLPNMTLNFLHSCRKRVRGAICKRLLEPKQTEGVDPIMETMIHQRDWYQVDSGILEITYSFHHDRIESIAPLRTVVCVRHCVAVLLWICRQAFCEFIHREGEGIL